MTTFAIHNCHADFANELRQLADARRTRHDWVLRHHFERSEANEVIDDIWKAYYSDLIQSALDDMLSLLRSWDISRPISFEHFAFTVERFLIIINIRASGLLHRREFRLLWLWRGKVERHSDYIVSRSESLLKDPDQAHGRAMLFFTEFMTHAVREHLNEDHNADASRVVFPYHFD